MIVPKELIKQAKETLGEESAIIIANDLKLQNFDEKNLKSLCPFHFEESGSFVWNQKDNYFKCFGCGKTYGIIDHFMSFNGMTFLEAVETLFEKTKTPYRFGEKGVKTNRAYRYPIHEKDEDRSMVEKYWESRKISKETLDYSDVQQDAHGNTVFHFYDLNDVLCTVKYKPSHKIVKGSNEPKTWAQKDKDTAPLLFGMNKVDVTKPLVITEGEPDTLAIIESGWKNVVSVPFGSQSQEWIEYNWEWLEQFDKIIIWSDNDKAGLDMRKNICPRLGTWRTYFVELPVSIEKEEKEVRVKDANEVLYYFGKDKVIDLIENAQEIPVKDVVNLARVPDFDLESAEGLFTGISGIDDIVYKFLFGSVIILTGTKGSGKSTLLNQIFVCEALHQGHDVFMFSGELSNSLQKSWIESSMIGRENVTMKDKFIRKFNKDVTPAMREWYDGRIWSFDESSGNNVDEILDRAINITRKNGAKIWILDNLMSLDIGADDNNIWQKQKEFIVRVTNLAKVYNVLVVLVAHPRKTTELRRLNADDVAGSNDLGNLAQYIIGVHRYSEAEKKGVSAGQGRGFKKGQEPIKFDVAVEFFKNRYTGNVGETQLYFDYPSYRFYRKPEELWKRYGWNKSTEPIPKHDPNNHGDDLPEGMD